MYVVCTLYKVSFKGWPSVLNLFIESSTEIWCETSREEENGQSAGRHLSSNTSMYVINSQITWMLSLWR